MPARTTLAAALAAMLVAGIAPAEERPAAPLEPSESWEILRPSVVGESEILDGGARYSLAAPFRAHDAATVPIRFTQAEDAPHVARLIIVIDENPAPVAATFDFGAAMQPVHMEMRVRVDAYTNVRAIVETVDGATYMTGGFVRAAGGCSAPALKDAAESMASLGKMQVRWPDGSAPAQSGVRREAQVMLRHPNYSGLQRDQLTRLFIPAHFVDTLEVRQGDALLFSMTGGISISEDPTFRFSYTDMGGGLSVSATDTKGTSFVQEFPVGL